MDAKFEFPNPEELGCFIISLKIASRKFVLEKTSTDTQTSQKFQPGNSAIQCIKLRMLLVISRQGNLSEDRFLFCWDKLIKAALQPPGFKYGAPVKHPTRLLSSHCFFPACPILRQFSKPPTFEF